MLLFQSTHCKQCVRHQWLAPPFRSWAFFSMSLFSPTNHTLFFSSPRRYSRYCLSLSFRGPHINQRLRSVSRKQVALSSLPLWFRKILVRDSSAAPAENISPHHGPGLVYFLTAFFYPGKVHVPHSGHPACHQPFFLPRKF